MRKAWIGILMAATAATPLWAAPGEHGGRYARQNESSSSDDSSPRPQRQQAPRVERQQQQAQPQQQPQQQVQQAQPRQSWRSRGDSGQAQQVQAQQQAETRQAWQGRSRGGDGQNWRGRGDSGQQVQAQQQVQTRQSWQNRRGGGDEAYRRTVEETREASRRSAMDGPPELQRQAAQNQARFEQRLRQQRGDGRSDWNRNGQRSNGSWSQNGGNTHNWNRSWRNDNRYDWQRYRYSNRNIFRVGPYYAPYRDYRYSRLSIGLFLGSAFFGQNYWIDDPWQYRLPPADYGTHWVRYYDDVLLVDDYTGEVLDVIYDFFW